MAFPLSPLGFRYWDQVSGGLLIPARQQLLCSFWPGPNVGIMMIEKESAKLSWSERIPAFRDEVAGSIPAAPRQMNSGLNVSGHSGLSVLDYAQQVGVGSS